MRGWEKVYQVGRLAAVEIVNPRPVWNEADGPNHVDKVLNHPFHSAGHAADKQTLHDPVGVPIVRLSKAAARDDKRSWQRNWGETLQATRAVIKPPVQKLPPAVNILCPNPDLLLLDQLEKGGLLNPVRRLKDL